MTVLFIYSGNKARSISPIINAQSKSLEKEGIKIIYYPIVGKGITGYVRNIFTLHNYYLKIKDEIDISHAHFSWSSIVASLAGVKPLVVSLMGSDVEASFFRRIIVNLFTVFFWKTVIVKTEKLKQKIVLKKKISVIPNGVDFERFYPMDRNRALRSTKWDSSKRHILFAANPKQKVKNFPLAESAFKLLNSEQLVLHCLKNVPHGEMIYYFNSADVVLLSSKTEGSVNVIKEAMACNRPIVTTDVGDVQFTIDNTPGCYIAKSNKEDLSSAIRRALNFNSATHGREKIQYLSSTLIATRIISIYQRIIDRTK